MKKSKPLVSVFTLTYRRFDKLREAVRSVYMQSYEDIEYIISDDGSENFDRSFVEGLIPQNRKNIDVRIIHNESNMGIVKHANAVLALCHGIYIIPLAGDDSFFDGNCVSAIVNCFENQHADIVTARRAAVESNGRVYDITPNERHVKILKAKNARAVFNEMCVSSFISGACTYYSKRILNRYQGFDESYQLIEDFPFIMKVLGDGYTISYLDKITIKYGRDGLTGGHNKPVPMLTADRERYYRNIVFPNEKNLTYMKRKEMYIKYNLICHSDERIKLVKCLFLNIDGAVFFCVRRLVRRILRRWRHKVYE